MPISENIKYLKRYTVFSLDLGVQQVLESPTGEFYKVEDVDPIIVGLEEESDEIVSLLPIDSYGIPMTSESIKKQYTDLNTWFLDKVLVYLHSERPNIELDLNKFPFQMITSETWEQVYQSVLHILSVLKPKSQLSDTIWKHIAVVLKQMPPKVLTDTRHCELLNIDPEYCALFPKRLYTQEITDKLLQINMDGLLYVPLQFITKESLSYWLTKEDSELTYSLVAKLMDVREWSIEFVELVFSVIDEKYIHMIIPLSPLRFLMGGKNQNRNKRY